MKQNKMEDVRADIIGIRDLPFRDAHVIMEDIDSCIIDLRSSHRHATRNKRFLSEGDEDPVAALTSPQGGFRSKRQAVQSEKGSALLWPKEEKAWSLEGAYETASSQPSIAPGNSTSVVSNIGPAAIKKRSGRCASSSAFRGVTRHSTTGRYEAHLWDSSWNRPKTGNGGRTRGKQVYLGGWLTEEEAAEAYDKAAIKYWGQEASLNFKWERYQGILAELNAMTREEVVALLKRNSTGFSRGQSQYRGVTRHHQQGRWEARIGRVHGNKYMYLGTFNSEEEAAQAYDRAAVKYRGKRAVTNFGHRSYTPEGPHCAPTSDSNSAFRSKSASQKSVPRSQGVVKEEQMAPSTPSQPGVHAVEGPAPQLWSAGLANATDVMLQQMIPDLWPNNFPHPRAAPPLSAGSEASAESAIPEGGAWEATSGLMHAGPMTPHLEELPSGWNLSSMELQPFEPQALDIFEVMTDEQVLNMELFLNATNQEV